MDIYPYSYAIAVPVLKHHAMKRYRGLKVELHVFLN